MASATASPDDSFFNDLSQRAPRRTSSTNDSPTDARQSAAAAAAADAACESNSNEGQPRAKRIACVLCRKRKLRCDGARPKCGTCSRLSHDCGYDEVRKKSGPKRGYVKLLEQRLQQVETLLKSKSPSEQTQHSPSTSNANVPMSDTQSHDAASVGPAVEDTVLTHIPHNQFTCSAQQNPTSYSWEMIGLGLEEPLPQQDAINELHQIYFERLHPSVPMLHRPRYLAAMNLAPNMRPPVCLRYMVWGLAASTSDKYISLAPEFYRRARKYAEIDEMKGNGENMLTLAHTQTWLLIAWYEFKNMFFPRAWQSTGRAASLSSMMGLNRLDGAVLDVKQCLPPPKDWTEKEERRRTFWMTFCADRYASIGTGWPHRLDERDIMTVLPSSDEAFEKSSPMVSPSLEQAFSMAASNHVSAISAVIMISCLLGRNLTHLHRPEPNDNEEDLNGAFWQRHRQLESILSNIALALPDHLRVPAGLPDPNVIFMNMLLHTSVICLHQAAIFKADRNHLAQSIINESRSRCLAGAQEITRIMKMMSHIDLSTLNPFLSFCLYVAARVFVQYLKWRPKDQNMTAQLQFLGSAMQALSRKNPLTESFMAQLEVDLEGTGICLGSRPSMWNSTPSCSTEPGKGQHGIIINFDDRPQRSVPSEIPVNTDAVKCSPLFEIRDSQSQGQTSNNHIFRPKDAPSQSPNVFSYNGPIDINVDSAYNHLSPNDPLQFSLPNRGKDTPFAQRMAMMDQINGTASEMDFSSISGTSTAKSRSNSYKDSSSHNSFTPPSVQDSSEPPFPQPSVSTAGANSATATASSSTNNASKLPASPLDSSSSVQTPGMSTAGHADVMFFEVPDAAFQTFQPQLFTAPFGASPADHLGMSSAAWDMPGIESASTGPGGAPSLASMPEAAWSEILETAGAAEFLGLSNGGNRR